MIVHKLTARCETPAQIAAGVIDLEGITMEQHIVSPGAAPPPVAHQMALLAISRQLAEHSRQIERLTDEIRGLESWIWARDQQGAR